MKMMLRFIFYDQVVSGFDVSAIAEEMKATSSAGPSLPDLPAAQRRKLHADVPHSLSSFWVIAFI
jgi:hypothetical protein